MEVDIKEMQKQRKEEILKSGKYALVEVVVGENEICPIGRVEMRKISLTDKAKVILTLDSILEHIIRKEPEAFEIAKGMKAVEQVIETPIDNKEDLENEKK